MSAHQLMTCLVMCIQPCVLVRLNSHHEMHNIIRHSCLFMLSLVTMKSKISLDTQLHHSMERTPPQNASQSYSIPVKDMWNIAPISMSNASVINTVASQSLAAGINSAVMQWRLLLACRRRRQMRCPEQLHQCQKPQPLLAHAALWTQFSKMWSLTTWPPPCLSTACCQFTTAVSWKLCLMTLPLSQVSWHLTTKAQVIHQLPNFRRGIPSTL